MTAQPIIPSPLNDDVVLVTGASGGFGLAIAEEALARGASVVATSRSKASLDNLARQAPDRVLAAALDLSDPKAVDALVRAVMDRFGRIDALVNNAGHGMVGAVEETGEEALRAIFEPNFFGAMRLTRAVLPVMREARRGAVVQISSFGGMVSVAGFGAYCATKFALEAMSEALAAEVAPLGIRVLIVEPGAFRTRFAASGLVHMPELPDYAATAGSTRAFAKGMDGTQAGDPRKAARRLFDVLGAEVRPLRLALGDDALAALEDSYRKRAEELGRWAHGPHELDVEQR